MRIKGFCCPSPERGGIVAVVAVQCPERKSREVVKYGRQPNGEQRYRCNQQHCQRRILLLQYHNTGWVPEVKQQMVEMALNGSGIDDLVEEFVQRDEAGSLHIPMRLLGLMHQVNGVGESRIQECAYRRAGLFGNIIFRLVHFV
jgi:transposase-like protein